MTHACPDCGLGHEPAIVEEPVVVDVEPAADAAVQIAAIEADRDVTIARVHAKTEEAWQESRVAELEGRLAGMAETLERLTPPEPEPVPVVIAEPPAPEPIVAEPVAEPPPVAEPAGKPSKRSNPWW